MIRVVLPTHLRNLARVTGEVRLEVAPPVTQRAVIDALEAAHPVLGGTVRDRATGTRRPFVRFFVGEVDRSHDLPDTELPPAVAHGEVAFTIVGAMAGG